MTDDLREDRGSPRAVPRRRRRRTPPYGLYAVVAIALFAVVATAIAVPVAVRAARGVRVKGGRNGESPLVDASRAVTPTPFFASYRTLRIHMPIAPKDLTAMAFHQASYNNSLPMTSLVPVVERGKPGQAKSAAPPVADGGTSVFKGKAYQVWRSGRGGQPDTAIDVGAKAGSPVYAPLTGKVAGVRHYMLYGKYEDYEVHIWPDGWPEVDCVVIHVDEVLVRPGDSVIGGATQIASVRLLSDRLSMQLANYSGDGGNHAHVQLNRLKVPGKLDPVRPDQRKWHLGWVKVQ